MIRLLTAVLLFASFNAVADDLRTFSDGQVINADDFNHNFQKLEQDIANGVTGPQGEQGIQGEQGEQGPAGPAGPAGADGADGVNPFENLSCNEGDTLKLGNNGWECSSSEAVVTAFVTFNDWQADGPDGDWEYPPPLGDRWNYNYKPLSYFDVTTSSNIDFVQSECQKRISPSGTFKEINCSFEFDNLPSFLGNLNEGGCAMRPSGHESKSNLSRISGGLELEGFLDLAEGFPYTVDILCYAGPPS